jgi:hypothetical protein
MKALEFRVARLEHASHNGRHNNGVTMAAGTIHDEQAVRAAIAGHQRRTGWTGPMLLVEPELTEVEWLARYGRT